jgi:predicted secreted protein
MTITAAIVLFAVIWFMVFFVVLPLRFTSQAQAGEVVPGTPKSAPAVHLVGKKAKITTAVAIVLWVLIAGVILSGAITVRDLDFFGRMQPQSD